MPDGILAVRLPHRVAPGAVQMASDEALLEWASTHPPRAAFRTYGWSRATLSLGRAEPFPQGWDLDAIGSAGIDVVRRPTGGDAVLHDEEMTFAVAASIPGPWARRPRIFADLVAEALAQALRDLGLPAERVLAGEERVRPGRPGERPCFAGASPGEVRVGRYKVAGIASRFARDAVLSHASVPLSPRHRDVAGLRSGGARVRADLDGHARSAAELLGRALDARALGERLAWALEAALGTPLRPASFPDLGLAEPGGRGEA